MGHINRAQLERLICDGILRDIDFNDMGICVNCIKGNMSQLPFPKTTRSKNLSLIHADVCTTNDVLTRNGQKYFITFIDGYSRYGYVYLVQKKSDAFEAFKVYKAEVENQIGKSIKVIRSDRGGELSFRRISEFPP